MTRSRFSVNCISTTKAFGIVLLLVVSLLITSCSLNNQNDIAETSIDVLQEETSPTPKPTFPSFIEFVFCNVDEKIDLLSQEIEYVQEGIASRKDVAVPLKNLAEQLGLAGDMIKRVANSEDDTEVSNLFGTDVNEILTRLEEERIWFLQRRVRLLDFGEFSSDPIEARGEALVGLLNMYCKEE